jgi:SAM-dependent methyltransferase
MSDAQPPRQPTRWEQMASPGGAAGYARRFAELAASGVDPHGEAAMCAELVPPGSRVLDAGCGTGRASPGCAPTYLAEFDQWCEAAGLGLRQRFSTWGRAPWDDGGYAVSVHARRS